MILNSFKSIDRFFKAKSVVFIGGKDLFVPIRELKRRGFKGKIFVVNPKRPKINNYKCLRKVSDLPLSPDAAFIAVPAKEVISTVRELKAVKCKGIVCYSAGFKETGKHGKYLQDILINECGDIPLIGPNCYGFINFSDSVALWPFSHKGTRCKKGVALITQSGMLSSDIIMATRSLPISFMVSAGNQAVTKIEDLIFYFCKKTEVSCIAIHIEGISDLTKFVEASKFSFNAGKPIIVYKTGRSQIGKRIAKSHTGSLSGNNEVYSALFKQLAITEVHNPIQLLETAKLFSVASPIKTNRILAFTCSGGGAAMVADNAEQLKLSLPGFSKSQKTLLKKALPQIATISNPLDYTTPIWGIPEKTGPVFKNALKNKYSTAILIQDFPNSKINDTENFYLNDTRAFIKECKLARITPIICSTLPENINEDIGNKILKLGGVPMQGIFNCLKAINHLLDYYNFNNKKEIQRFHLAHYKSYKSKFMTEYDGKLQIKAKGIKVPFGTIIDDSKVLEKEKVPFPLALKFTTPTVLHKTEMGAVELNINNHQDLVKKYLKMKKKVGEKSIENGFFFIEEMLPTPIAEMFLSIRQDKVFGDILVLGMGGSLTELYRDIKTFVLPTSKKNISKEIKKMKFFKLINGFRNKRKVDLDMLTHEIFKIVKFHQEEGNRCDCIEINPVFVYENTIIASDCVLCAG
ncbi:acetate--CoA ligase family protein [Paracoccaceae bacterium]|nr:acetate--CoA ligase family protein [Paracoccaceae bacterium]